MIHRQSLTAAFVGVAAAALLACSPTDRATPDPSPSSGDAVDKARAGAAEAGRDIKEGAEKAGDAIKEGAEKTGDAIKEAAHDVKEGTKPAAQEVGQKVKEGAQKVKEGAQKTGSAVDATKQHMDVKAALLADKNVDASHIDIDVDRGAKTLYLRGTVPTAAQKALAERIARDKAEGFSVRNELTVVKK